MRRPSGHPTPSTLLVLIGGVAIGSASPDVGMARKPLGDAFVALGPMADRE